MEDEDKAKDRTRMLKSLCENYATKFPHSEMRPMPNIGHV